MMSFIGVMKTTYCQYLLNYLQQIEFSSSDYMNLLVTSNIDNIRSMISFLWFDCYCCYLMTNMEGVEQYELIYQQRWRQVSQNLMSDDTELVQLTINHQKWWTPAMALLGKKKCTTIIQDIEVEKYCWTNRWSKQVNLFIFATDVVDARIFHQHGCGLDLPIDSCWNSSLAPEMINYIINATLVTTRGNKHNTEDFVTTEPPD